MWLPGISTQQEIGCRRNRCVTAETCGMSMESGGTLYSAIFWQEVTRNLKWPAIFSSPFRHFAQMFHHIASNRLLSLRMKGAARVKCLA